MSLGTLSYESPQEPPSLENDRRKALIGFGIFSILFGVVSGAVAVGVANFLFHKILDRAPHADIPELVLGLGTYIFFAFGFIALGVGSIRCRRWVRPVVLAFGTVIIAGSLLKFTAIVAAWEKSHPTNYAGNDAFAASHAGIVNFATTVFGVLIGLAVIYMRFYGAETVRRTLGTYDVRSIWCEELPLPVLIAAAGLFVAGMGVVLLATDTRAPFGGARLSGAPSVMIKLLYGMVILVCAALVYQMKVQGCRVAIFTLFAGFAVNLLSRFIEGTDEVIVVAQGQMGPTSATPQLPTPNFTVILAGVVCVGYLLWVDRFFRQSVPEFQ